MAPGDRERPAACAALPGALPGRNWVRSRPFIDQVLDEGSSRTAQAPPHGAAHPSPDPRDSPTPRSLERDHVRERKPQLGLLRRETFVPQSHSSAQEAQVDWMKPGSILAMSGPRSGIRGHPTGIAEGTHPTVRCAGRRGVYLTTVRQRLRLTGKELRYQL